MRYTLGLIFFLSLNAHPHYDYNQPYRLGANFTYQDFEKTIQVKNPQSIEEFLSLLPADLRSQVVLMRDSRSLQQSEIKSCSSIDENSMPLPRALLMGKQGLVIAFNDESQAGGSKIEIVHQKQDKSWEFVEYTPGQAPVVNPAKCLRCHRPEARPIWDGYPCWKGAYGEDDDVLKPQEKQELSCFFSRYKRHPRYKFLENIEKRFDVGYSGRLPLQTNSSLLETLYSYNNDFIIQKIKGSVDFDKYKYAIAGAFLGCYVEGFVPPQVSQKFPKTFNMYLNQNDKSFDDMKKDEFCKIKRNGNRNIGYLKVHTAALDYVMLNRGIDVRKWFLSFHPKDPAFLNQGRTNPDFYASLLGQNDPQLKAILGEKPTRAACSELQNHSLFVLSQ